jgi:glycosyltransferase involved in cell wall biosynthesis
LPELSAELAEPIPDRIAVGAGTCMFVRGRCDPGAGAIRGLDLVAGGVATPVIAHGVDLGDAPGSFWGLVPLRAIDRPAATELSARARLAGGRAVEAPLATLSLVPGLPRVEAAVRPPPGDAPLVAICIATYEPLEELLRVQLESIRGQTHSRWICVISDDASSPASFEALRELVGDDERFAISRSPDRLGAYRNFERALRMVPGEAKLVALADQDDRWFPDKLEALVAELGDAVLAYSDMRITDESGTVISPTFWRGRRNNYTDLASLLLANTVTGAASLFRRELLDLALPFPPMTAEAFHDQWLASAALASGDIAFVERPLQDYVQHGSATLGHAAAVRGYRPSRLLRLTAPRQSMSAIAEHARRNYFVIVDRIAIEATTLELRTGGSLAASKGRAVRRLARLGTPREPALWLGLRSLRRLAGRNETVGIELSILSSVIWRRISQIRGRH